MIRDAARRKASGRTSSVHGWLLFGLVGASGVAVQPRRRWRLAARRSSPSALAASCAQRPSRQADRDGLSNFFLNNALTYRDRRLVGWQAVRGLISFMAVCCLGAVVNIAIARDVYAETGLWLLAGIAGAVAGALVNYSLTSVFTWRRRTSQPVTRRGRPLGGKFLLGQRAGVAKLLEHAPMHPWLGRPNRDHAADRQLLRYRTLAQEHKDEPGRDRRKKKQQAVIGEDL